MGSTTSLIFFILFTFGGINGQIVHLFSVTSEQHVDNSSILTTTTFASVGGMHQNNISLDTPSELPPINSSEPSGHHQGFAPTSEPLDMEQVSRILNLVHAMVNGNMNISSNPSHEEKLAADYAKELKELIFDSKPRFG